VLRDNWRDPHFWGWWWRHRVSVGAKIVGAVAAISLLGFGGYAAAGGLNSAVIASSSEPLLAQVMTVERFVTLRESGRVVTKPIRVVRTVPGRGSTSYETQVRLATVTMPGNAEVVVRRDVETVPVIRRVVVTRDGVTQTLPAVTQVRTSRVTDQRTVTNERVLTSERVVTQPVTTTRVVTNERVVTQPVTTTRVVTETFPVTVRRTDTIVRTETETRTETVPVTVVETLPPVTVTVTVRKP
jgi:hypothetical protein